MGRVTSVRKNLHRLIFRRFLKRRKASEASGKFFGKGLNPSRSAGKTHEKPGAFFMHSKGPEKPNEARVMLSGSPASCRNGVVDGRKRNAFCAGGFPCRKKSGRSDGDPAGLIRFKKKAHAKRFIGPQRKRMKEFTDRHQSSSRLRAGKWPQMISQGRPAAELDQKFGEASLSGFALGSTQKPQSGPRRSG